MHTPVYSQHALDAFPGGQIRFLHLNDEVEHRESLPIRSVLFSQGGSHQLPCLEAFAHSIWQRDDRVPFAPVPDSCLVRIAEAEPRHTSIQIKSQTIGLAFFAPIVACIRE